MKWTWLLLFAGTMALGVFILRACPKSNEATPALTPTVSPELVLPKTQNSVGSQLPQGNGPLSTDSGVPKPLEPNNIPSQPITPPKSNNSTPPSLPPPVYQNPSYNDPGDPNGAPPPLPPPPIGDGDFDGLPPPAFEAPEEFMDPNSTQPQPIED